MIVFNDKNGGWLVDDRMNDEKKSPQQVKKKHQTKWVIYLALHTQKNIYNEI